MNLERIAQLVFGGIILVVAIVAVVIVLGVPLWLGLAWWFGHLSFELVAIVLLILSVYISAA